MKALSKVLMVVMLLTQDVQASIPSLNRVIYTSGEKTFPVYYKLGQSTVLELHAKPDVVICGNKNYFNIEKLKTGVTIQPLSNFSTNLTILSKGKRFLFYLVPTQGSAADGFVDVRWVNAFDKKAIAISNTKKLVDSQTELNQEIKLGRGINITVLRVKSNGERHIIDLKIENKSETKLDMSKISLVASLSGNVLLRQSVVWEKDIVAAKSKVLGRLIVKDKFKGKINLRVEYAGKKITTQIRNHFK